MATQPGPLAGSQAGENDHAVGIHFIARHLGTYHLTIGRITRHIAKLVEERHFPKPFPSLKAGQLTDAVTPHSRWHRAAVEDWLGGFLPPDAATAVDLAEKARAGDAMDQRAANLFQPRLIQGGRQ